MHQAIPFRSWRPLHNPATHFTPLPLITHSNTCHRYNNDNNNNDSAKDMVVNMVSENAVIVIGRRGCCMSHVVKRLLLGLGVNPAVHEVEEEDEASVARELEEAIDDDGEEKRVQFPAVFIGGKLFGGLDRLMATHISGELVPLLKEAGALWL
ncbi:glutaredoxin-C9-like [Abrus precatorius]|uniref:Glutaredoxin-C9-like n=1 Tax=Abrus precatorius TaxID=3816 RepID=A0A8B8KIY9_ABRPR|nr:glutaredoxin-C9-like [Abrus precatorius]